MGILELWNTDPLTSFRCLVHHFGGGGISLSIQELIALMLPLTLLVGERLALQPLVC